MPINKGRILYEDEQLLAVLKLSGELVVKGKGTMEKMPLFDFLRKEFPGIHPLQRLDFETSGVLTFARSRAVLKQVMDGGFKGWKKTYVMLVMGNVPKERGEIRIPLPARTEGKVDALTRYRVLERFGSCTYVEAQIETGRHHQIRRHFQMIGHPLVLDSVYGDRKFNGPFSQKFKMHRFFLHASSVSFPHPGTGETLTIDAPIPLAFERVLGKLRESVE